MTLIYGNFQFFNYNLNNKSLRQSILSYVVLFGVSSDFWSFSGRVIYLRRFTSTYKQAFTEARLSRQIVRERSSGQAGPTCAIRKELTQERTTYERESDLSAAYTRHRGIARVTRLKTVVLREFIDYSASERLHHNLPTNRGDIYSRGKSGRIKERRANIKRKKWRREKSQLDDRSNKTGTVRNTKKLEYIFDRGNNHRKTISSIESLFGFGVKIRGDEIGARNHVRRVAVNGARLSL